MSPFENKTPQEIAAIYKRGTDFPEFISELVNSKCKEAGIDVRGASYLPSSNEFFMRSIEAQNFIDKTRTQVRENLIGDLVEGRLVAAGRRLDVNGGTRPEVISWEFWDEATPSYAYTQYATKRLRYGDIRILNSTVVVAPAPDLSVESSMPDKPTIGRRPTRQAFESGFAALRGTEGFKKLATRTEQARAIRAYLHGEEHRKSDAMNGFKTETLKRWIGEALRRER